jgi:hypothetical protein
MTPTEKYCKLVFHRLEVGRSSRIGTALFVQFRCPRTIFVPEGHDPHVKFEDKIYYMPMESWIPGPRYRPMPPMNSWFWRPGFKIQSADKIAGEYADCRKRNSNLLLNLSPDTSGRLPEEAVSTVHQAARIINGKS